MENSDKAGMPVWDKWALVAVGVAAATVFIPFGVYLASQMGDLKASDWAAWVQAVGSVVAIAAAVWIASDQRRVQMQRDLEAAAEARERRAEGIRKRAELVRLSMEAVRAVIDVSAEPGLGALSAPSLIRARNNAAGMALNMIGHLNALNATNVEFAEELRSADAVLRASERFLKPVFDVLGSEISEGQLRSMKMFITAAEEIRRPWLELAAGCLHAHRD